jgi:CubicO group peptidase (beta-lactamase class C family)
MPLRNRRCLLGALAVSLTAAASAQPAAPLDSLARAYAAEHGLPSLVLAVSVGGERHVAGVGAADSAGTAPDAHTAYEIGSISKVLTALALAEAVGRGEVALETPVRDLLPDSAMVEQHAAGPVRLWHLATHTSGLPRLAIEMGFAPGFSMADPYALYDAAALYASLSQPRAVTAPGETFAYSNLGVGLLGHALARHAGTTYGALVADRVLGPLGMTGTALAVSDTLRRARGHDAAGEPVSYWTFQEATAGAGGYLSTAADLLTLGEAALDPASTPLADALALSLEPRFDVDDDRRIGLGWFLASTPGDGAQTLAFHAGGTGGFRSFLGVVPGSGVAVVALTNAGVGPGVDALAVDVLRRLIGPEE